MHGTDTQILRTHRACNACIARLTAFPVWKSYPVSRVRRTPRSPAAEAAAVIVLCGEQQTSQYSGACAAEAAVAELKRLLESELLAEDLPPAAESDEDVLSAEAPPLAELAATSTPLEEALLSRPLDVSRDDWLALDVSRDDWQLLL